LALEFSASLVLAGSAVSWGAPGVPPTRTTAADLSICRRDAGAPRARNPVLNSSVRATDCRAMADDSQRRNSGVHRDSISGAGPGLNHPRPAGLQPLVSARCGPLGPVGFNFISRFGSWAMFQRMASKALKQSVGAVCRNARSLSLRAEGVGFFPNPRSPRVIWVGINNREGRLVGCSSRLKPLVGPFSPEPGEKNFTGHVTLGRLKKSEASRYPGPGRRAQSLEKRPVRRMDSG